MRWPTVLHMERTITNTPFVKKNIRLYSEYFAHQPFTQNNDVQMIPCNCMCIWPNVCIITYNWVWWLIPEGEQIKEKPASCSDITMPNKYYPEYPTVV